MRNSKNPNRWRQNFEHHFMVSKSWLQTPFLRVNRQKHNWWEVTPPPHTTSQVMWGKRWSKYFSLLYLYLRLQSTQFYNQLPAKIFHTRFLSLPRTFLVSTVHISCLFIAHFSCFYTVLVSTAHVSCLYRAHFLSLYRALFLSQPCTFLVSLSRPFLVSTAHISCL
jgi:hypothetical protein